MASSSQIDIESSATLYPLSPIQEGMLFHCIYARQPGVDISQIICDWQDKIDASVFSRAWQQVVERHAILRTSFTWEQSGSPRQRVQETLRFSVGQQDWSRLSRHEQDVRLEEFLRADRQMSFDSEVAPLMRVTLIRLAQAQYRFVWTVHHLLVDAHSFVIVLDDFFVIYQSLQSGQELPLKPAPRYREYIDWLQEQDWSDAESFWRRWLEGFTTPTSLPVSGRPNNGPLAGPSWAEEETVLTENLISALRELAKAHGLTLNTFLQGAWSVVLSRYSGEEDVVFGAVKSCRHLLISRPEEIAGPFINTLPVRVRCAADHGLIEWLKNLRDQWVALRPFEHSPLAKVQSWSQVPAGRPLFQTILSVLDPAWDAVLHAQGDKYSRTDFRIRNQPNFPLALDVYVASSARLKLVYDAGLFGRPAMKRMLGHLRTVLESMACAPQQRVADLPLLTEPERLQLLENWNQTEQNYPETDCVHRLFEAQVKRSPEALAVASRGVELSYAQLNEQANRVAHRLRALGVGPEMRVGICMERSVENVAGLLGILKTGGAYVPLDPEYPTERLAFMIADAKIGVLLTQRKWMTRLPAVDAQVICLDEMEAVPARADDLPGETTLKNLAYVIYTSGSTGTPKGVEIEHQGVVNLIRWHQERYQVRPEDRATQLANLSFDASVWEMWPYLTAGASIHIPDEEIRLNPAKLVQWLADHKITLTFLPTPLAEAIMDGAWPEGMALRALLTGGDRLHRPPRKKLPFQLVNHYGPTENSVVTTAAVIEPQGDVCEAPPVGRPIANTRAYVLDARLRPVPIGVPGELYVAGHGLARGYLDRPKLTAEKFITHPFSNGSFSRLYRTGDLVRYREDGNLEFLGRIDHQVKLRGCRIELGEIEAALSGHADVREAVVGAFEDGETRLAAYVVPEKKKSLTAAQLRDYLKQKLPEHMVPSGFVFLDALPLTPNGKVDRKGLPQPEFQRPDKNFVAPRTRVERLLADIWCELLRLQRVGVHDNFFALGGHSLLATQLVSRVRSVFGVELPLQTVFEQPTLDQFAARLKEARRDQGRARPLARSSANNKHGEVELSFAQERLWFLEQLEPGLAVYNVPIAIALEGNLDIPALKRSLNELVARHGIFRTSFKSAQEHPKAQRAETLNIELPVIALPSEERLEALMATEAAQPFDLTQAPLIRAKLVRLGSRKHLLLLTTHHIASDGWSMAIFYQELRELYEGHTQGKEASLPELSLEYDDYARWQRDSLQGELLEEQLAFWKRQLQEPLAALDLPLNHPRPAQQSHRGKAEYFALSNSLCADLKTLCRQEDVTLFMLLFATYQALLHRYSGQDDIVTGTTVAGRTRSEIEGLAGLFLNTLALRTDMSGEVTFRGLLQQVRKVALEAYAHQDAPFEKVVEALGVERDLSRSPVFQTMFVLQKAPLPSTRAGDLEWRSVPVHSGTSKFDLTLSLQEEAGGLSGYVEYDCDLFESDTVLRMLGHFQTLLQAVVVNPDQKLWELPLLTTAERQQVLVEWNGTAPANSSKDLCLHQLIEEQAARTPDHAAIVWQQQTLTYHELNRRANQLARRLRAMGVGPDVLVALFLDRSPEMLVGIMGILTAGGAYVPLDPDHPKKRLASILEDSKPLLVLTQQSLVNELPSFAGQSICLDADWAEIAGQSENLVSHVKPEHLAYVLFTSGSTGRPKGVALEHRSAVNFVQWAKQIFTPQELAGVLFSTSICFDLSVFEIFVTLSAGGTIILAPNALQLPTLSEKDQVTLVNTVPSVIAELLRMDALPASVRTVNLAGEALSDRLVEQLYATANVEKVYNLYGPTETTTYSTYTLVRRGCPVTIGRPIADTQCYILDASRNPVPIGVTGELYISGTGLARGYYGRPELTAERFVPDQERGERMYRTGDLCRWTPDGNIQYLGRADHQVKLRGLRIELGEIEHALADDQGVKDAVVKIWEDRDGDKWLVAYYIPSAMPLTAGYLRDILQAKLPDYMVPSHFVAMEAFPLTPNGKLNRKALPAPEVTACARGYEAPLGEIESTLAQIWCDVLKVERVGRHDHFFDLGGHSLLTIKTVSRIRDVFEMDIPTRTLFEKPTLADLAKILTGAKGSGGNVQRIEPRTQSGLCALSFAQERFWLLHQLAPASPVYNIVDVIRFEGTYEAAMRRALKELVRRHEILRTAFADSDEQPMQIVLPTSDLVLSELDLSALPAQEREREWIHMVRDEGRKPFDLSQAPLLRGTVVHLSPQEHRLLLTLHHIIADEWSMEVLHQEVNELYAAFSQGQPSALPELPIQYADFAIWQRDWLQGGVLQGQLAYWKDTLAGAPSLLELPTDKPRPAVQSLRGATETFALPKDLLERLKALGRQHQATLFMTLEASFAALLHRYTGQEDILVGTPISGRRHSETERLIGCFLNTVVLRTQFTDDLTFRSLLRQVRERALGAYAHQDLPFDHLVAELAPQRDPSRTPLVQVMFTLFNTGGVSQTSKVSGIRELETGTSKFDLTLSISETEDGLEGVVEYSTDLFDAQTIRRLYGHYGTLLEEIARDPEQRISKLPMLTASERHQILNEWNNMARNYPKDECVHHLFEKMAKQATNRTAVECGGRSLTYGQLNAQASRLADYLRDLGVGPGVIAGIYVERSLEMVIALLAILKTGGTYLPLDAAYPVERLAYMIEDSRALLVLTQKSLAAHLQEVGVTRVLLDDPLPDTDTTAHQTADPEKAAYVIYTSGSTGKPKGVAVPHRGVVNFLTSMAREPGLSNTDVLVAVTTLSFDIAVLELLLPLTVGAKLVVASHDAIADGDALRSVLERHGATAMQATPITWRLLIEADWHPPSTFKALVGGEPLPKDLADELIARGVELWNMYGPTETTVWSTCARIVDTTKGITIGKPIANTTVRILDERKNLCPIGIPGELCIGGGGVALGYWNRPELTAERFISDPFDAKSGARLYRTGDRARWRNDGTLEHLGRLDFQVKLRGFRIELGEIETGIAQHPAVREVAVLVREDTPADKRLVAYLVSDNAPAGLIEKVRARLRAAMPEYMVPSQFVMLDALPRTHNGKLDRKALPAPAATDGSLLHREAVAPRTPTEEMVLDVFQDVLDRTDFGVSDNFFDLGGHSLMAARLMSKLRAVSGTDLPLRDLFARPTAAALAEAIDALQWLHKSNVPRDYVGVREEIVL